MKKIVKKVEIWLAAGLVLILMLVMAIHSLMQPWWLMVEYNRFEAPSLVLTKEERITWGIWGVNYIKGNESGGRPPFQERELAHLGDVKKVASVFFKGEIIGLVVTAGLVVNLRKEMNQNWVRNMMNRVGVLTVGVGVSLLVVILGNWEGGFEVFHQALFEDGSWLFTENDLIINLYPEQFWRDSAVMVVVLSGVYLGILWWIGYRFMGRSIVSSRK